MEVIGVKTARIEPPQDNLLQKIKDAKPKLQEGDCVAITSKVVSIWQGRCVKGTSKAEKDKLAMQEAELYLPRSEVPRQSILHTYKYGYLVGAAGIDTNNANGHFVLWPLKPKETAQELLEWFKKEFGISKLSLIITDSHSTPLRRGAMGFALSWAGFAPLHDHGGEEDVFGKRTAQNATSNVADALAAAAVLVMGEVGEQTPIAIIRDVPYLQREQDMRDLGYEVKMEDDVFAPFLKVNWKKGGSSAQA